MDLECGRNRSTTCGWWSKPMERRESSRKKSSRIPSLSSHEPPSYLITKPRCKTLICQGRATRAPRSARSALRSAEHLSVQVHLLTSINSFAAARPRAQGCEFQGDQFATRYLGRRPP